MLNAIQTLALMAMPAAFVIGICEFPRALRFVGKIVEQVRPPRLHPQGPPIERLAADLRRISADLDALVAAGPIPGRILKVRSTTAAYDETLLLACRALDVEPAGASIPMSSERRLQTEAALASAGLSW